MEYCLKHQDTATNLKCGKCETLICPRCMVHTPVGVRCKKCAQLQPLPTFDVSGIYILRAIVAGLISGVVGGVGFVFISPMLYNVPFLGLFAIAGLGYLIGEGISAATDRKRGRSLKMVAAGSVIVSYSTISVLSGVTFPASYGLLAGIIALYLAVSRF